MGSPVNQPMTDQNNVQRKAFIPPFPVDELTLTEYGTFGKNDENLANDYRFILRNRTGMSNIYMALPCNVLVRSWRSSVHGSYIKKWKKHSLNLRSYLKKHKELKIL